VALLVKYSAIENRQSCKYSKIAAASVQNEQISSKKRSFAQLLLHNPLSYTIIHNISMGVVAIGGPLSLTVMLRKDDHDDFDDFWILGDEI
jgi:hypothetical protein